MNPHVVQFIFSYAFPQQFADSLSFQHRVLCVHPRPDHTADHVHVSTVSTALLPTAVLYTYCSFFRLSDGIGMMVSIRFLPGLLPTP
jgi:hypothetical protein